MLKERILVITGAGISAESGIPTFRGTGGYWRNLDPAKLATPEAFQRDPELIWAWYRERRATIRTAQPNAAHLAITRLAAHCPGFLLVTQNVDDLHVRARYEGRAMSPEKMVQIHGDIFLTRCSRCDNEFHEFENDRDPVPTCAQCGALMRPGVVWFGESLDPQRIATVERFLAGGDCDVVLVVGTTAMFGYIVDWALRAAGSKRRLIEINPDSTALTQFGSIESMRQPAGTALPRLIDDLIDRVGRA